MRDARRRMKASEEVKRVEAEKTLMPLGRTLPATPMAPEIDVDGKAWYRDFKGNLSQAAEFVTDGHMLLRKDALDPRLAIRRGDDDFAAKYATEAAILKVWNEAEQRDDVLAAFIGVAESSLGCMAFLRDPRGPRDGGQRIQVCVRHARCSARYIDGERGR